jgi:RNA polymerase sigma factor (sigma-70 family)
MKTDADLLQQYVADGSEAAFEELVTRHVDLVFSAAMRLMDGDAQMAQDVMQMVFVDLARKSARLTHHSCLAGWLYTSVRYAASGLHRKNQRRQKYEWEARPMNDLSDPEASVDWTQLQPVLDEAMNSLGETDRHAVLLRYFERKTLAEVGRSLGTSESTARKRVERGVEKLRLLLKRRGITSTSVAFGTILTTQATVAAPTGSVAVLTSVSLVAAASTSTGPLSSLLQFLPATAKQTAVIGLVFLAGVTTPIVVHSNSWVGPKKSVLSNNPPKAQGQPDGNSATAGVQPAADSPLARLAAFLRRADERAKNASFDENELRFLVWSLPLGDYPAAWRLGDGLNHAGIKTSLGQSILTCWAELDPISAVTAAANSHDGWRQGAPLLVLETWARQDPIAALAWVRRSAPPKAYAQALGQVLPAVAETEPQIALSALEEIPEGQSRRNVCLEVVRRWASHAPGAAAEYLMGLPRSGQRSQLIEFVASEWAKLDPPAALDWSENLGARDREATLVNIVSVIAQISPERAASYLDHLNSPKLRWLIPSIVQNWAASDLRAAAEWTRSLWAKSDLAADAKNGPLGLATYNLLQEWCKKEPGLAAEFAIVLPDEAARKNGIQAVLASWSGRSWQAAQNWADHLPAGSEREAALKGLCQGLAKSDPAQAANFVASLPPGDTQSQAAIELASTWTRKNPQAAAQWVASFPEGETRQRAAAGVMESWVHSGADAEVAANWLKQLPDGPTRDQAAQSFVGWAAFVQPELAASWVSAFKGESERNQQIENIARKWLERDPEAARKWLQTTSLPEEMKNQLIRKGSD